ncbi:MAG: hypothetical protein IPO27_16565 [Bacteroidetes bacterium]|nr:hypothetical protein [Bacteroidota bacterium]
MNGNTNSNPATQFIGMSDNKDFVFRTNNTERFRVKSNGDFKLAGLGSTVGMLYVDANGILQAGNKPTPCLPLQGPPVWQSIVSPATIWTCTDVKVGLGTTSPLAKLDVTHDEPQGGLILHQYNTTNNFKPSEIKFMHNNLAQWSIGSHLDPVSSGPHSFFIWNIPNTKPSLYIDQSTNRFLINSSIPSWATHPFQLTVSHVENHGGIAINKSTFSNRKSQISFQQNFTEKYAIGIDRDHLNEQNFFIWDAEEGVTRLIIDKDGRVAIGTEPPVIWNTTVNYKLYVGGGIATQDVRVTSQNWPDYVFEKDYHLEDIDALKSFITKNKHLPGIPSAQEIAKNNGFELGAMQVLLLQKLEEQTLYIIQLQEQINRLNKIIIEDPKQKGGLDEK